MARGSGPVGARKFSLAKSSGFVYKKLITLSVSEKTMFHNRQWVHALRKEFLLLLSLLCRYGPPVALSGR